MMILPQNIWQKAALLHNKTIGDAIQNLNASSLKIVLVVGANNTFIGTVSDGDIRRAMLRGETLKSNILQIVNKECLKLSDAFDETSIISLMRSNQIFQIPIVNAKTQLVGLHIWSENSNYSELENVFVVMAGGQGKRLRPYTEDCPKPLLKVSGRPMLEHIVERAKAEGFKRFIFSINYLGHMIREHFGDGSEFGVLIDYIEEDKPLGTAGSLSLIKDYPKDAFIVCNGDVITDLRYSQLIEFHKFHNADATMAVKLHEWQNPFGVVITKGFDITGFEEKPIYKSYVNAGIYALNPEVLNNLEHGVSYTMPDLFETLRQKSKKSIAYPIHETWLDVGRPEDLN